MADDIKVLHSEVIQESPWPGEVETTLPVTQTTSKDVISPTTTKSKSMPTKKVATELISSVLNTKSRKILGEVSFTQMGAIQCGEYQNGISGDTRITADGIVMRNKAGLTTIGQDGDTGDAVFAGQLQSGSLVTGTVNVGDGDIQIDGENKRMVFYDENGLAVIVIGEG